MDVLESKEECFMKLIKIPIEKYDEYRINAMFDCYKWDPKFYDSDTLSNYVLVLNKKENEESDDVPSEEELDEEVEENNNLENTDNNNNEE